MGNIKAVVVVLCGLAATSCATSPIVKGTLIGAASGAALGAGTGLVISDADILGSPPTQETGNLALRPGTTIAASTLIGAVFGAIVGAMVGRGYDEAADAIPTPGTTAQSQQLQPTAF